MALNRLIKWPLIALVALFTSGIAFSDEGGTLGSIRRSAEPHTFDESIEELARASGCPRGMASIDGLYCIDRYEASLVEVLDDGREVAWSPFESVEGRRVRAVSRSNVTPQGYISGKEAARACAASGKRLCKSREWLKACMGPEKKKYGYSDNNEPRRCNDYGRSPLGAYLRAGGKLTGDSLWTWGTMNEPALNQFDRTLAPTGSHRECTNGYGVYDMVGNLHEWVDEARGMFRGGYYQDTHINGDGCSYRTKAHPTTYHDYSTGFRCCSDADDVVSR